MLERIARVFFRGKASIPENTQELPADESNCTDVFDKWTTTDVDGHRVDIFDSTQDAAPAGCVLFLHGHGGVRLNQNQTFSRLFQKHNLVAVCPDGQRSWWMDRVCDEFSANVSPQQWILNRLLPFIQEQFSIEPPKVALLGVSMGGQGALQLSYRHAHQFPVVAAISPAVDFYQLYGQGLPLDEMYDDVEDARQDTVVLNLHPLAWPRRQWLCCDPKDDDWFDGCARLGMKLSSSGVMYERDFDTSAGGHTWDYFDQMAPAAIRHIVAGLASC